MGNICLLDSDSLTVIKHNFLYFPYLLCSSGSYQMYASGEKPTKTTAQKMNALSVTVCDVKYIGWAFWSSGVPQP